MTQSISRGVRRLVAVMGVLGSSLVFAVPSARAEFFGFNANGGKAAGSVMVGGFDFSVGNALAYDAVSAFGQGRAGNQPGATFQLYYQATLANLIGASGGTIIPDGLNRTSQITVLASITEEVTSAPGAQIVTFRAAANQSADSFFQMYHSDSFTARNGVGTGFIDGTLILSARPTALGAGNFLTSSSTLADLNRFGGGNYAGVQSVLGLGLTTQLSAVEFLDPRYFTSGTLPLIFFNGTNTTPFGSTEPALALTGHNGGSFLSVAADLGSINGRNGRDILFQMDANLFAVPEPPSLLLGGLGLAGLLVFRARKLAG